MKKILAIALAVLMIAALAVPAFAVDPSVAYGEAQNNVNTGSAVIKYGVDQTYTVTLPSVIDFGTDDTIDADVIASNVIISGDKKLVVNLTSATSIDETAKEAWTMISATSSPVEYGYYLDTETAYDAETAIRDNNADPVLTVPSAAPGLTGKRTIWFATKGTSQAGSYQDTLTFSIAVVDKNS